MSIDLDWNTLDGSLSSRLVELLNKQLTNTSRPSFIGPIEVSSLDFGSIAPDIDLVDLRDIHPDFLEDDGDSETSEPVKVTDGGGEDGDEEFEWVSRRAAVGRGEELFYDGYYRNRFNRGPTDMFASTPALHSAGMKTMNMPGLGNFRSGYSTAWPFPSPGLEPKRPLDQMLPTSFPPPRPEPETPSPPPIQETADAPPEVTNNDQPNLQMHFHITWPSDLRITLTTSLLINYPSPMFMSLPIKLSVTGVLFNGEVAVAYEGSRRRVHICVLDDLDPYGPAKRSPNVDDSSSSSKRHSSSSSVTPPDLDDDSPQPQRTKPLPAGQRLLPAIYIESEIGQADKHVLKNVSRVERFIQDVIRKTMEEELVFPNFHTLVMGEATA